MPASKKILYIDLDNTLVNFQSGIDRLTHSVREKYQNDLDEAPHIFSRMDPLDGAIDAYHQLAQQFATPTSSRQRRGRTPQPGTTRFCGSKSTSEWRKAASLTNV